jgi:hypothetical protein
MPISESERSKVIAKWEEAFELASKMTSPEAIENLASSDQNESSSSSSSLFTYHHTKQLTANYPNFCLKNEL